MLWHFVSNRCKDTNSETRDKATKYNTRLAKNFVATAKGLANASEKEAADHLQDFCSVVQQATRIYEGHKTRDPTTDFELS